MAVQGITFRELADETKRLDPRRRGLTYGYLGAIARGRESPSLESMELIASALDIPASSFLEYRLGLLRRQFDERHVGAQQAASNLAELVDWLATGSVRKRSAFARLLTRDLAGTTLQGP